MKIQLSKQQALYRVSYEDIEKAGKDIQVDAMKKPRPSVWRRLDEPTETGANKNFGSDQFLFFAHPCCDVKGGDFTQTHGYLPDAIWKEELFLGEFTQWTKSEFELAKLATPGNKAILELEKNFHPFDDEGKLAPRTHEALSGIKDEAERFQQFVKSVLPTATVITHGGIYLVSKKSHEGMKTDGDFYTYLPYKNKSLEWPDNVKRSGNIILRDLRFLSSDEMVRSSNKFVFFSFVFNRNVVGMWPNGISDDPNEGIEVFAPESFKEENKLPYLTTELLEMALSVLIKPRRGLSVFRVEIFDQTVSIFPYDRTLDGDLCGEEFFLHLTNCMRALPSESKNIKKHIKLYTTVARGWADMAAQEKATHIMDHFKLERDIREKAILLLSRTISENVLGLNQDDAQYERAIFELNNKISDRDILGVVKEIVGR